MFDKPLIEDWAYKGNYSLKSLLELSFCHKVNPYKLTLFFASFSCLL